MFRELTRKHKQITAEECAEVLKTETRGVLSVIGDEGYPYGMPMNHYYNEDDGCIYFHCGKAGHRIDSLRTDNKVSFCVYDHGYRNEGEWFLRVKSVIVFGKIEIISDWDMIVDISTGLSRKFGRSDEQIREEIESSGKATLLLKLTPENICGKLVNEA